ncbi:hypothetical protein B0H16DRAFT_1510676 [Mycena metata]|uniref:Cyanovirin-N domain-containing protein n=1 Tax=Mycena metata TaxID=1033252 RepID=A0AAD7JXK9_9AGAR|nr:hypothetical protein B0H16DRAFT_1510676 [Mycena metata]
MQFTLLLTFILTAISGLNAQGPGVGCDGFFPPVSPLPTPAPPALTGPGNFGESCNEISIFEGDALAAACRALNIIVDICNTVHIGQCVGVQQPSGNMVCQPNGGAGINGTCTFDQTLQLPGGEFTGGPIVLTGHCGNIQGGITTGQIDLNLCFENVNGVLGC